jgi:hypothetical protein
MVQTQTVCTRGTHRASKTRADSSARQTTKESCQTATGCHEDITSSSNTIITTIATWSVGATSTSALRAAVAGGIGGGLFCCVLLVILLVCAFRRQSRAAESSKRSTVISAGASSGYFDHDSLPSLSRTYSNIPATPVVSVNPTVSAAGAGQNNAPQCGRSSRRER